MRGLRLYEGVLPAVSAPTMSTDVGDAKQDRIHARSRFRSLDSPDRYALYSMHDRDFSFQNDGRGSPVGLAPGDHTLMVVREFRRVPLRASALALTICTARAGSAASVVATLAHFVERAVSVYQPTYLLLAHSLEQPRIAALLTGLHQCAALQAGRSAAFSLDALMPELRPMLSIEPEVFGYCSDSDLNALAPQVDPYAV
jgi:hypothetical protein